MPDRTEFFPLQIIESMILSDRALLSGLRSVRDALVSVDATSADDLTAELSKENPPLDAETFSALRELLPEIAESCKKKRALLHKLKEILRGINDI